MDDRDMALDKGTAPDPVNEPRGERGASGNGDLGEMGAREGDMRASIDTARSSSGEGGGEGGRCLEGVLPEWRWCDSLVSMGVHEEGEGEGEGEVVDEGGADTMVVEGAGD